jgi:5-methylcytosine-specific restriction endonuclease McrA
MLVNCAICGKEFRKGRKSKYCSMECQDEAARRKSRKYNRQISTPWLKLRFEVFARDEFTCQYCGRSAGEGVILQIDHIKPTSKGGTNDKDNLITACKECNMGKSDSLLEQRIIRVFNNRWDAPPAQNRWHD